jgi:dTDP-4-dehydrorhamnose 3,5-epimerase
MKANFKITESDIISGVYIVKPSISVDLRGNIWSSFLSQEIDALLPKNLHFMHDKFSESKRNVIRGIHGDTKSWKLVTCVFGSIDQVVVDLRKDSNTYNQYIKFNISSENQILVLIPPGLGNAYLAKTERVVYHYKLAYDGEYIDAADQFTYRWNDQNININWGIENPILSERDSK